ncbi:sodium:solute symporter [Thioclava dalianensis]|uniref:histidine kinase n=1 Tax=Thioclava dalianensis TaxID=1185766 RepID=A0A074TGM0_9RHOB|nr:ATP-binding protein [Thioclava dalianensis]KEP70794.1 sodium:solute symporter [Thioclava dalianensis]SFN10913.1 Na+/proline symporter [Thioclava dalianensis]
MGFNSLVAVCLAYVIMLFAVAFMAERRARRSRLRFLRSPWIYTLSLSIYCTAWTFYGAVGYAARSGLEFLVIYLGPTLVFVGWWWLLRKLVRIGRTHRITSIADLISSRYGKSNALGVIVTLMSVVAATPYIALQLQSVTLSFDAFAARSPEGWALPDQGATALWIAGGLALFTILFGTRNLDANERHHGVVTAIALEAVVKLVALIAVGVFVVWGLGGGPVDMLARIDASPIAEWPLQPGRFAGLTFVSAAAVLTLPRMFQVLVVENVDERHLATASWAFPGYLMLMSLFVVPIAVMGLELMPEGSNPDLFVLTLPLSQGQGTLALLAFLGGFSSATSMVIVAAIALATMVSNHIVTPLWLALRRASTRAPGDVRGLVLISRRLSIIGVLSMGYMYYRLSGGSEALAAIGLIAFVGAAQVLPALLGGIFWRGATHVGAMTGLLIGFAIWAYTLFLPSVGDAGLLPQSVLQSGPFGIGWLRPHALFGIAGLDPILHALFWSLLFNALAFLIFSMLSFPGPLERLQGVAFVNVFDQSPAARSWAQGGVEAEDLLSMAQRILGAREAQHFFQTQASAQGKEGFLPDTTSPFIARLERKLAGSVGAATAHAMIAQLTGGSAVSMQDLIAVADETAEAKEYSATLEAKSEELARVARALRDANDKLRDLSVQKDSFLSQISHELRTPMTSIRAFSEILMEPDLPDALRAQYAEIIHEEARRLTRLLDDLLDLSVLENRGVQLNISVVNLHDLLNRALQSASSTRPERAFRIERDFPTEHMPVFTDTDRLVQVFINLISNARKYCDSEHPVLRIEVRKRGKRVQIDFIDNGAGIAKHSQKLIFEKFARLTDESRAGSAGLGLAICREIMANLGGTIDYLPGQGGAAFRVSLPLRRGREVGAN